MHGFVQHETDDEEALDETQPMSYAVIRISHTPPLRTAMVGLTQAGFVPISRLMG